MLPQDSVPTTIEQAVEFIFSLLDGHERMHLREMGDDGVLQFGFGRRIRNAWSLWDSESPLKREAVASYGISHADDISQLILAWVFARIKGYEFDPVAYCHRFREHWKQFGVTS